jgi:hypothetical protein
MAAGLAGLLAVTGCDTDPRSDGPGSQLTTAPPVDADSDLADEVLQRISEAASVVAAGRRQDRALRRKLGPLAELHGAHAQALGYSEPWSFSKSSPGRTLVQVRAAETKLQRQLTDAAVRAESGALAKLLASMAAAVAQHLAVL